MDDPGGSADAQRNDGADRSEIDGEGTGIVADATAQLPMSSWQSLHTSSCTRSSEEPTAAPPFAGEALDGALDAQGEELCQSGASAVAEEAHEEGLAAARVSGPDAFLIFPRAAIDRPAGAPHNDLAPRRCEAACDESTRVKEDCAAEQPLAGHPRHEALQVLPRAAATGQLSLPDAVVSWQDVEAIGLWRDFTSSATAPLTLRHCHALFHSLTEERVALLTREAIQRVPGTRLGVMDSDLCAVSDAFPRLEGLVQALLALLPKGEGGREEQGDLAGRVRRAQAASALLAGAGVKLPFGHGWRTALHPGALVLKGSAKSRRSWLHSMACDIEQGGLGVQGDLRAALLGLGEAHGIARRSSPRRPPAPAPQQCTALAGTSDGPQYRAPASAKEWRAHRQAVKEEAARRREETHERRATLYEAIFGHKRACVSEEHEALDTSAAPFKALSEQGREVLEALEYFEDNPEERGRASDAPLALTHVQGEESEGEESEGESVESGSRDESEGEEADVSDWEGSDEEGMAAWIVWDGTAL